jgi:hypothetical protein
VTGQTNQLRALFFTRFASSFGLLTLLPTHIELLGATSLSSGRS